MTDPTKDLKDIRIVKSAVLGTTIALVPEGQDRPCGMVQYWPSEIAAMKGLPPEAKLEIHELKTHFGGRYIGEGGPSVNAVFVGMGTRKRRR